MTLFKAFQNGDPMATYMQANRLALIDEAGNRAANHIDQASGDVRAAFDRMGIGVSAAAMVERLVSADISPEATLGVAMLCVEADRANRLMLTKAAKAYADADRRWRRDVAEGQQALDGIEPARYVPGDGITHRQMLRTSLFAGRAKGCCEDCGRSGKRIGLDLHHVSYARFGREESSDVLLLCRDCHDRRHPEKHPPV